MLQGKDHSSVSSHRAIAELRAADDSPATDSSTLASRLRYLIEAGADRLPLPGQGNTLSRWRALADVASLDLGLVKLFEGHTDSLAILAEHDAAWLASGASSWGMWAAEPPFAKVRVSPRGDEGELPAGQDATGIEVRLDGVKAWCSGAPMLSHALLTAWDDDQQQRLVAISLDQPGVTVTNEGWQAVGMAATASVDVHFEAAIGQLVGPCNGYLDRPGFWQGGAGIAACWFGGARRLGEVLEERGERGGDGHLLAHLGAVDVLLGAASSVLREAAEWIDTYPREDAWHVAQRARSMLDTVASDVLGHCSRALGAGAYCRNAAFARMAADLPVFIRQNHAERDLEALGRYLAERRSRIQTLRGHGAWSL
ncbi:acyl-CoA dehydrogenase family protein [Modicisalibacter xianhensis]|uniref:Acyl-CoA dehydrogenase n=1 Tax=Modicisalibacter xianhensis TaxID=442341 RepID=A0A1I3CSQ8_9GAMM|nr:acyl-CoA dehydrogenase family protein [Halomonas xianhensis]SFH77366.1 Acyl-CoA dehydrogenase [Halomonas xianhensis]